MESLPNNCINNNHEQQQRRRRLMVCAPTNKAVSVLALRFLNTLQAHQDCPFNAILVGDADKLLAEDSRNDNNSLTSTSSRQLETIFLYNWLSNIIGGYRRIRAFFAPGYRGHDSVQNLARLAENMQHRITNSLPMLAQDFINAMDCVTKRLQTLLYKGDGTAPRDIVQKTDKLLQMLQEMPPDVVWTQLLLSADVIFTTLASAGGGVFKNTSRIDDLIVDEAAAATEPELYIPFFLRPARLLAVGDPMQLPATVLSRKAIDLGLAKSLHERLMYDCRADHIMLNVQYRMSCQISAFPSEQFYNNKIGNGPNVTSHQYLNGARLLDGLPYMFLQVEGREEQDYTGSLSNRAEASKIVELVVLLRTMANESERFTWNSSDKLRIITFYQAQVSLIKRMLHERGLGNNQVMVATVDSSQGCEADVVLISFVRSAKPNVRGQWSSSAGFLTDDRRMNVALTRARYQLICVGNVKSFQHMAEAPTLKRLAANAHLRGVVRTPFGNTVDDINARLDMFYGETPDSSAVKKFRRG
jgi:superfamily I DNA and/or RNA helicase